MVYDVDFASGKIRWQRELRRAVPPHAKHLKNTFASETPVTDGQRVYVCFGSIGLVAALDFNGNTVWTKGLGTFATHRDAAEYGSAASPVLHNNRLYVVNDNLTQSFLVAFDAKTGAELWRVNREEDANWSTPYIWTIGNIRAVSRFFGGLRAVEDIKAVRRVDGVRPLAERDHVARIAFEKH